MDNDFKRPLGNNASGTPRPAVQTQATTAMSGVVSEDVETMPSQGASPEPAPKKKSRVKKFFLWFLVALLTLGPLGAAAGWYWMQNDNAQKDLAAAKTSLAAAVTAKDAAETKLAAAEKKTTTTSTTKTDDQMIIDAITAYNHAAKANATTKYVVTVTKKVDNFASAGVSVTGEAGGFKCVTKKVDTLWVVLYCGQDNPLQPDLDKWGVPATLLTTT